MVKLTPKADPIAVTFNDTRAKKSTSKASKKPIPKHVILAWDDVAKSVKTVFAKWPSKLVSFEIVKQFMEGK